MTYYNGGGGGSWIGESIPIIPVTAIYCDPCAETAIPLPDKGPNGDSVGRHWNTGFKWAPLYGGNSICSKCGKPV